MRDWSAFVVLGTWNGGVCREWGRGVNVSRGCEIGEDCSCVDIVRVELWREEVFASWSSAC